jgi:hypothetical protein
MSERVANLPPEQQAIRDKCFHPRGTVVEFPIEDIEISIPARFEKIVRMYPDNLAVKTVISKLELGKEYVAHSDSIQVQSVAILTELLKVQRVGIRDNYFDLGGHTLSAMRDLTRISDCLHVEISVGHVVVCPTVMALTEFNRPQRLSSIQMFLS